MKKKREVPTVDVLSHNLVPEMKVLGEAEKTKLLHRYGINEQQLPKIYSSDPEVTALKAKLGDVVRCERDDGTGKYTSYRIVIED